MDWTIEEYKKLYLDIVSMSVDCDSFGLFEDITEEDVEKCKYIAAILDCLSDVPIGRVEHIFKQKGITEEDVEALTEKVLNE